jgi:chromosome segregation ATPase
MDTATAAHIAALEDQVYRLTSENVRITNRAGMDREEIDSMGKRNDELRAALDASKAREEAYRADVVRLTATVEALRQNANDADLELAKAMSRADVLAAAACACQRFLDSDGAFNRAVVCDAMAVVRSTNALDPAKFEEQP